MPKLNASYAEEAEYYYIGDHGMNVTEIWKQIQGGGKGGAPGEEGRVLCAGIIEPSYVRSLIYFNVISGATRKIATLRQFGGKTLSVGWDYSFSFTLLYFHALI